MAVEFFTSAEPRTHFLRWILTRDELGEPTFVLECATCHGIFSHAGWSWTPAHLGPTLGEVLERLDELERESRERYGVCRA